MSFESTKVIDLGSCAFRQPRADSHCKFLHGYRLKAKFWFTSDTLDENHWVVDFGDLKELKKILEKQFDHTTCIAFDDPHKLVFETLHEQGVVDLRIMPRGTGIERIAEWCYKAANNHVIILTEGRCVCSKVEVWEHENNSAICTGVVDTIEEDMEQLLLEDITTNTSREEKSTWDLGTKWI
jgi:6-pyruvoyltetrahydropterin/6-carboxytetrahydropterin synthase